MIIQIEARNFLNLESFAIDFSANRYRKKAKRMALLYGENGIGKSSVLRTLDFLTSVRSSITNLMETTKQIESFTELDSKWAAKYLANKKRDFLISGLMSRFKTIKSEDPTVLVFEGANDECSWRYEISCDYGSVLIESLSINEKHVFLTRKDAVPEINDRFIKETILANAIKDNARMYFGPHSFLSCMQHTIGSLAPEFKTNALDKKLQAVLSEINNVDVFYGSALPGSDEFFFIEDDRFLNNLSSGVYDDSLEGQLKNTEDLLSAFFRSFSENIVGAHYAIVEREGQQHYSLRLRRAFASGEKDIPFVRESTGIRELLSLFCVIHHAMAANATVAIDEIEAGLHDSALEAMLASFQNATRGQIITSTQNLRTIKYQFRKAIYILARDDKNLVYAEPMDPSGRKIQKHSNGTAQYLGSHLAPVIKPIDLQELFANREPD